VRAKFELLAQARKRYLAAKPVRTMSLPSQTADGTPGPDFTFPNLDDVGVVGCKLGMEYLAICHDGDAVEEWINEVMSIAKEPDHLGIVFANVFRGVNVVIGEIISNAGLRSKMQQMALEAWNKDFSEGFPS
jgi:hypothetical protein